MKICNEDPKVPFSWISSYFTDLPISNNDNGLFRWYYLL